MWLSLLTILMLPVSRLAYDAAWDRCESMHGPVEDQCIAAARARFHQ